MEEARNGEEALGAVRQRPFDLVLLDINMPGIGGIEACRRIRDVAPQAGIVMVTVRDAENDKPAFLPRAAAVAAVSTAARTALGLRASFVYVQRSAIDVFAVQAD